MFKVDIHSTVDDSHHTYKIPEYIVKDSKLMTNMMEDFDEDEDTPTIPLIMNHEYFEKALEYYLHYAKYFKGERELTDEDKIRVVTRQMVVNPKSIQARKDKEASENIVRSNDVPTEVFYPEDKEPTKYDRIEDAKERISLFEEFPKKWMNAFERNYIDDFHFISSKSDEYPSKTHGILFVEGGRRTPTDALVDSNCGAAPDSIKKYSLHEMIRTMDYLLCTSLSRFLEHYRQHITTTYTKEQVYEMLRLPLPHPKEEATDEDVEEIE